MLDLMRIVIQMAACRAASSVLPNYTLTTMPSMRDSVRHSKPRLRRSLPHFASVTMTNAMSCAWASTPGRFKVHSR